MRRIFAAAAAVVLAASVILPAQSEEGGPWIAAAFNTKTLSGGFAEGVKSRDDAIAAAMEGCGEVNRDGGCEMLILHNGGCIADARSPDGRSLGLGHGMALDAAKQDALKQCSDSGRYEGCEVHTNFCAGIN